MPELPDLQYIRDHLDRNVKEKTIDAARIDQPIVIRNTIEGDPTAWLPGRRFERFDIHGPFIRCGMSDGIEMIVNLMLAGHLRHHSKTDKRAGHLCVSLGLDDGMLLDICDEQKMAKVYFVNAGKYDAIPRFDAQGIDILSAAFTQDAFLQIAARHGRKQTRVFLNDHTILSAIGNAYADEILFQAKIHPKTFVGRLSAEERIMLYHAIREVIAWGTEEVRKAAQPIHVKIRDHLRVRNRKGEACPVCGSTIRREGVRGYDVFFCARCQPATRDTFIRW